MKNESAIFLVVLILILFVLLAFHSFDHIEYKNSIIKRKNIQTGQYLATLIEVKKSQ
jgi:hypothetical protein